MHVTATPGAWPVVLTPFTASDEIDFDALDRYVDWLIDHGAEGLFAVALSGEMYELSEAERRAVAARVVRRSGGRVPVAASVVGGRGLLEEAVELARTGVDVVVLIASAVLDEDEDESRLLEVARAIAEVVPQADLGIYECPLPYHRVLSERTVAALAATGRFVFFKETSHDVDRMAARVAGAAETPLRVFNAGIENFAESVQVGVAGLSGWVVNVAPDLVARLGALAAVEGLSPRVVALQRALVEIEQRMGPTYPGSAKAIVERRAAIGWSPRSRWRSAEVDAELVDDLVAAITREAAREDGAREEGGVRA